ncbi:hypothetical protein EYF80_003897 [Liparis tanakae]|uniref:Uncharacterized protein n=1 Tax=Liparis tanakae TaxID=230148 RepID=A0A4Z2J8Q8_9TELE|nr:hypothetical protein EYF80_003897 [Liparis tanakae]
MRQLGRSLDPNTDFICVAVSMRFWNTSALRSSLQEHNKEETPGSQRGHKEVTTGSASSSSSVTSTLLLKRIGF